MKDEKKKQILIIEDDSFLLQMYAAKLAKAGFNVKSAIDGARGLKKAKEHRPDLILLDLVMPLKGGFQVLEELKIDPDTQNIPVIILSNLSEREDVQKCLQLGAVDYLIKAHFVPSEVVNKIDAVLAFSSDPSATSSHSSLPFEALRSPQALEESDKAVRPQNRTAGPSGAQTRREQRRKEKLIGS